ncbi:c-type cytochrome [Tautonia sociabilis]|uniref:Cytochrome c n=1 Tax=Tautonia sociabilis TaxID=2080755 RepID=A0A432MNZ6_9BACT|nr:c-type cytochrome [Tautonia sociabilis]RUL89161.1 cytochrome c [Tautonia sociabilis]
MRGALVSILAAVVLVAGIAVGGSSVFFPPTKTRIDVAHGQEIFNRYCASCHSVKEQGGSRRAPSLHRIGEVAGSRVPGQSAEEYLLTSILKPDAYRAEGVEGVMPPNVADALSKADLINLVSYLSTLGGRLRPAAVLALPFERDRGSSAATRRLELASIERGRALFLGKGNCSSCHSLRTDIAGHNLMAPTLEKAGLYSRADLEAALREPSAHIVEGYETWMASAGGVLVQGRKLPAPEGKVRLLAADDRGGPELLEFDQDELEPLGDDGEVLVRVPTSRMPPVGQVLDREEVGAVLDFLLTLR